MLETNSVLCVISFPNDLFYPQASVEPVIVIIKKGQQHSPETKTLFVRITDDGFVKLKKRRLPHGGSNQLDLFENDIKTFIAGGTVNEVPGFIQVKNIDMADRNLEIIPQQHLDNAELNVDALKSSMGSIYSELVFQQIRRGMTQ
jgi:type I restriction-modification system DNA methylase subunit